MHFLISFFYILKKFQFVIELNTSVFCNYIYLMNYIFSILFSLCILFDSVTRVLMPVSWFDLSCMLTFGGGVAQKQVYVLFRDQADSLPSRLRHVQLKAKRNPVKKQPINRDMSSSKQNETL